MLVWKRDTVGLERSYPSMMVTRNGDTGMDASDLALTLDFSNNFRANFKQLAI
jgi:hypothetical protein